MSTFMRQKVRIIAGATICTVPLLNFIRKVKKQTDFCGQSLSGFGKVFAHEQPGPQPGPEQNSPVPPGGGPGSQTYSQIHADESSKMVDSVPLLEKNKTDPKYIQLPPPLEYLTLKSVHVFFRHGARLPLRPVPGLEQVNWDKDLLLSGVPFTLINYNLKWLDGTPITELGRVEKIYRQNIFNGGCFGGQLTNLGQDQMYQLGQQLRKRYMEDRYLIPDVHKKEFIQVTNIMRNIESMRCVLAGMFGQQQLEETGEVPDIFVSVEEEEILYPNFRSCAVLREISKRGRNAISKVKGERKLRKTTINKLGCPDTANTPDFLHGLRDVLVCRQAHGMPMPESIEDIVPTIIDVGKEVCTLSSIGVQDDLDKFLLLGIGPVFHMILENMDNTFHNTENSTKMNLYCVHDTTVIPMLMALKAYSGEWPTYGENIKYELYEDCLGDHWVRILHGDQEITLPNCGASLCRYEQFRDEVSHLNISYQQYESACQGEVQLSLFDFDKTDDEVMSSQS